MSAAEISEKIDTEQAALLSVIFRHDTMNDAEMYAFPHYKRIIDLFQYPIVCMMTKWLREDARRNKCTALIHALVKKALV